MGGGGALSVICAKVVGGRLPEWGGACPEDDGIPMLTAGLIVAL